MRGSSQKAGRLALLCAMLAVLCIPGAPAQASSAPQAEAGLGDRFVPAAQNARLGLYIDQDLGDIVLVDKTDGSQWWSNPPDAQDDPVASGMPKQQLLSQLYVKYVDAKSNSFFAASRFSAVNRQGISAQMDGAGVTVTLDFVREEFRIPVRYSLGEDYLRAEILLEGIEEYGENQISQITFLPYFGAGGPQESGEMFVPDGCGALIRFNNGRQGAAAFQANVYGDEIVFGRELADTRKARCHLPVFGIRKGESALLAVIHSGAAKSAVTANVSGKYTSYNAVSATYNYRILGSVKLPTKNFQNRSVQVLERDPAGTGTYEIRYYPLQGGGDYVAMAGRYRRYLIQEGGLSGPDQGVALTLDLYGAVTLNKPVLGIPSRVVTPLTSFDKAAELVEQLSAGGAARMAVRYTGWAEGGLYGKLATRGGAEGKLGGNRGLRDFLDTAEQSGAAVYLSADLLNVYQTGHGFNRFFDAAQNINRTISLQYRYQPNIFTADLETDPWMLLAPGRIGQAHEDYARVISEAAGGRHAGIGLESTGSLCYSDFSGTPSSRTDMAAASARALSALGDKGYPLMLSGADAYALPYASSLTHVPDGSSGLDIEDEEVPFYQIALKGLVSLASEPVNLCVQPRRRILACIETGMSPTYVLIPGDVTVLKNTRLDGLYSVDARDWAAPAAEAFREVAKALEGTQGQTIAAHTRLAQGLTKTVYANGITIYVNYTGEDAVAEGVTVPAMNWAAEKRPAP